MARRRRWLTKNAWRNIYRIFFAIPVRPRPARWGHWQLYALELEQGCFYVGITRYSDVGIRYSQHVAGKGAKWTKLHRPIRIIWIRKLGHMKEVEAVLIETSTTIQFIERYGVDRVRGGRLVITDPRRHSAQHARIKNRARQKNRHAAY